jgi:hypothetical protein
VQILDTLADEQPQLTGLEFTLLSLSVFAAGSGPWLLGGKLTEFLAPTAAACKCPRFLVVYAAPFVEATHLR